MADQTENPECVDQSEELSCDMLEVAIKTVQPVKKKSTGGSALNEQPLFEDDRLPEGWNRVLIQRQGGATAGKFDVYIISPQQKRFRSRNELRAFFLKENSTLNADDFDFSVCGKDRAAPNRSSKEFTKNPGFKKLGKMKNVKNTSHSSGTLNSSTNEFEGAHGNSSLSKLRKIIAKRADHRSQYENTKKMIQLLNKGSSFLFVSDLETFDSSPYFPWSVVKKRERKAKNKIMSQKWTPPRSPYNLLQENVYHNPWQLLIATILLNRSSGERVAPIFYQFVDRFPSPDKVKPEHVQEIATMIRPLGLHEKRAHIIVKFSDEFLNTDWIYPNELHGIGKYGNDSYRMFCINEWRKVSPCDALLIAYRNWLINNWSELCKNPELTVRRPSLSSEQNG